MLAHVLRTDRHAHRPLPKDSDLVRAVAVMARAGQDATWQRQQAANQLRSILREYFPAALDRLPRQARRAGQPRSPHRPWPPRHARRCRSADQGPAPLIADQVWASPQPRQLGRTTARDLPRRGMRHPAEVEDAYGHAALAILTRLDAAVTAAEQLQAATAAAFEQHPHAASSPASQA